MTDPLQQGARPSPASTLGDPSQSSPAQSLHRLAYDRRAVNAAAYLSFQPPEPSQALRQLALPTPSPGLDTGLLEWPQSGQGI